MKIPQTESHTPYGTACSLLTVGHLCLQKNLDGEIRVRLYWWPLPKCASLTVLAHLVSPQVIQTLLQVCIRVGQGGLRLGLLSAGHGEAPPGAGKICNKNAGGIQRNAEKNIERDELLKIGGFFLLDSSSDRLRPSSSSTWETMASLHEKPMSTNKIFTVFLDRKTFCSVALYFWPHAKLTSCWKVSYPSKIRIILKKIMFKVFTFDTA